jgi:RNA polymerase sigma-70 factor, ECF subfamily
LSLQISRSTNKNPLLTSHGSHGSPSKTITQAPPDKLGWDALQELILASRPRFLGIAYAILQSREDAEDAVQNALLSANVHLRTFEGRFALKTWLTRIINATLMNINQMTPTLRVN